MLTRWDPFGDIARLQDQMVQMFEGGQARTGRFMPAVDIYEEKDSVFVDAALPGVHIEDVNVQIEDNVLTISGERKFDRETTSDGYRRIEHDYGMFTRSFILPESVKADEIDAEMRDGVLRLRLPKRPEAQRRKIDIKQVPISGQQPQVTAGAGKTNGGRARTQPGTQQP